MSERRIRRLLDRRRSPLLIAAMACGGLTACGLGTAAVASGTGSSTPPATDTNEAPTIEISMVERELSPSRVIVRVLDVDEPSPLTVSLGFREGAGPLQPMSLVVGPGDASPASSSVLQGLVGDELGVDYEFFWDFASDLGDTALNTEIRIQAAIANQISARQDYVGNDQPVPVISNQVGETGSITIVFDPTEQKLKALSEQIEGVDVTQEVFVKPEVRVDGEWLPAKPAELTGIEGFQLALGPDGFVQVVSVETGEVVDIPLFATNAPLTSFPWDTTELLGDRSGFYDFRITVKDEFTLPGDVFNSAEYRVFVDNAELATTIDEEAIVSGGDRRGTITIPFQFTNVSDGPVRFLLQASADGQFDALPAPGAGSGGSGPTLDEQLDGILLDPDARAQFGIVDQLPFTADVDVTLLGTGDTLRCADLRGEANWFTAVSRVGDSNSAALSGAKLQLLRAVDRVEPADADWGGAALAEVVDLEPFGDGAFAVALTNPGAGWGLSIVELATGEALTLTAPTPGAARGVDIDPTGRFALVVANLDTSWRVHRIELPDADATTWTAAPVVWDTGFGGEFRGMAAVGESSVVIARPNQLVRSHFDLATQTVTSGIFVRGVQQVRDLELDGRDPRTLLMAVGRSGQAAGYLASVDLDTGRQARRPFGPIDDPVSLGQSADLRSLFVLQHQGGQTSLFEVGYRHGRIQAEAIELESALPADAARVRAAGGRTRLVWTTASAPRLWAGGGVLVEREVDRFDPTTGELVLTEPLPDAVASLPTETPRRARLVSPRPERSIWLPSGRSSLRWDASRFWPKGGVTLRIVPFTSEVQGDATEVTFDLTSDFDDQPDVGIFGTFVFDGHPVALEAAELDGDGRPDMAYLRAEADTLDARLFEARQFFQPVGALAVDAAVERGALALLDVDQDGSDELVYGADGDDGGFDPFLGQNAGDLRIVDWNSSNALRTIDSIELPGTLGTRHLATADLDQDGIDDVIALDARGGQLWAFFGTGAGANQGAFAGAPSVTLATATDVEDRAALVVGDFDGNGVQDAAVAAGTTLQLFPGVSASDGSWTTGPPVATTLASVGGLIAGRGVDVDADGRLDLALSFEAGGEHVRLFTFDGPSGGMADRGGLGGANETSTASYLAAVDVDRDGRGDLATGGFGAVSGVEIYRRPSGLPVEPDLTAGAGPLAEPMSKEPVAYAFADWIGNGLQDLITGNYFGGAQSAFALAVQGAPGDFREGAVLDVGQLLSFDKLTFADVNRDLLLDAIGVPPDNPSVVHVYLQDSPGSFAPVPSQVLTPPFQATQGGLAVREPRRVVVADFDSDGIQDVLAMCEAAYDGFLAPGAYPCPSTPQTAGNPDWPFDFLASDARESTFVLFRGQPDGTLDTQGEAFGFDSSTGDEIAYGSFATGQEPHGNAVRDFAAGDVNGDGRIDLLVAHSRPFPVPDCYGDLTGFVRFPHLSEPQDVGPLYEGAAIAYLNDGSSSPFSGAPVVVQDFTAGHTFRFADADGDGLLDALRFPFNVFAGTQTSVDGFGIAYQALELFRSDGSSASGIAGAPSATVALPSEQAVGLDGFDGEVLVADWTLDGVPDVLAPGDGNETSGALSRLWVLSGGDLLAGSANWMSLAFDLPGAAGFGVEARFVLPGSVADVDADGLPDLAVTLVDGDFGPTGSSSGDLFPAESAILLRLSPTFGNIETVLTATDQEWLALPSIETLRHTRFVDIDQDGNFELFGFTNQPGGDPLLSSRAVFVFSDR